jgi:hypothetical protein
MAAKSGQFAKLVLKIDGTTTVTVAKLRNWSYSGSVEILDATAAGDEWQRNEAGVKSWEGESEVIDVDTYYLDYLGEKATIEFYMKEGDTTFEEGVAIISGIEKNTPYEDLIDQSISFTGDGPLTKKTVTP